MQLEFKQKIYEKHLSTHRYPSTSGVCKLITRILLILFPEQSRKKYDDFEHFSKVLQTIEEDLLNILVSIEPSLDKTPKYLAKVFCDEELPPIYKSLLMDIEAILNGDPAAKSEYEVVRAYPGFYAIAFYRLAHVLYNMNIPILPRIITEYAHSRTGIDIHPGAKIGSYFFIDHGTGVVIGETAEIGKNVKLYQGVTLGALSVSKNLDRVKRHPTIQDNVIIYSAATVLGGDTIIGHNAVIGGNVWLTKSVPPYSTVYHRPQIEVKELANI